jgi:DNA-binding MarR family transcriptional regulator
MVDRHIYRQSNIPVKREKLDERQVAIESLATMIRESASELRGNLFLSLSNTTDIFTRYLDIETSKHLLNPTLFAILHGLIVHGGTLSPTKISTIVFRSKHAVTRAVDGLEKAGLVKRQVAKSDRRIRQVIITKKGLDFIKVNLNATRKMSETALSCLSQDQAEQLKSILSHLRKHLLSLIKNY